MMALLASLLLSSLLGSPHCAAMCGGLACFYAAEPGTAAHRLGLLAYNGGRLLSYLILGALAGALGAGVEATGRLAGITRAAAMLAGILMVVWGLASILRASGTRLPDFSTGAPVRRMLTRAIQRLQGRPPVARAAALGLLTTLLPCGWLYVFVATAGGTGSPGRGALVMAAFWLGTVPMMAGLGLILQRVSGPLRQRLPVMTAAFVVIIGLLTVAGRIGTGLATPPPASAIHVHR